MPAKRHPENQVRPPRDEGAWPSCLRCARDVGTLLTAPVGLLAHANLGDFLPALASAAVGSALLLAAATFRLARRDV
jgi:hypothetical protein